MKILVLAEVDEDHQIRLGSKTALAFARDVAHDSSGDVTLLLIGSALPRVSANAAEFATVLVCDHEELAQPIAERWAAVIATVTKELEFDLLVAASTTVAKDIVARAAGLLGGAMATDVIGHAMIDNELQLRRPMYAGTVVGTVSLQGHPKVITVRPSAYEPATPSERQHDVNSFDVSQISWGANTHIESLESNASGRPDVTEARVVVSGGRAFKNSDDFENLVGKLADTMGGGTGSSRALVDAGITPNELQVGQTGKIVAPDLYVALGISGAVQHLAGMKNSKVIVAINTDPDAPIFEIADYGLVGDVYTVVPELIESLNE